MSQFVNRVIEPTRCALFGAILIIVGVLLFVSGAVLGVVRLLVGNPEVLLQINEAIVWYSATPVVAGIALISWDL